MNRVEKSFCRICTAYCPINVEISDNKVVKVTGDRDYGLYGGYTCSKGRSMPTVFNNPGRLTHSLSRAVTGEFARIGTDAAISEIADKLARIISDHGPRSVAVYLGQPAATHPALASMMVAFLDAIGSPLLYSSSTIDQPGLLIADALHGRWGGGRPAFADCDAMLFVGGNPVVSKQYLSQNPARRLKDHTARGAKLVVIDPRATETTRRADLHLQVIPGEDVPVLAAIIRQIIADQSVDGAFISENVEGFACLVAAVEPFTIDAVSQRAGVPSSQILEAARILGQAKMAYIGGGTGVGMSGRGNLAFYLLLCLQTIRGFWPGAGMRASESFVLRPDGLKIAQPIAPTPAITGQTARVRELPVSVAGWPSSTLPDEILTPGEGQIRALFCWANPLLTVPQSARVREAFESLELLVTPNIEMSATCSVSDYVIATKNALETPACTGFIEGAKAIHPGYGWEVPHAQYTPALVNCPEDSDLIDDPLILFRVAKAMGLRLRLKQPACSEAVPGEAGDCSHKTLGVGVDSGYLNMESEPTPDDLLAMICADSVVSFYEVKARSAPETYERAQKFIAPREATCEARLCVGNREMVAELFEVAAQLADVSINSDLPFRLIVRRASGIMGSNFRDIPGLAKSIANPAYLHPADLERLGCEPGTRISIRSAFGQVTAIAASDPTLRRNVVSITHGCGLMNGEVGDLSLVGTNINELLRLDTDYERITGMPRMSAVPVSVEPYTS